jgi:hypothetical protein
MLGEGEKLHPSSSLEKTWKKQKLEKALGGMTRLVTRRKKAHNEIIKVDTRFIAPTRLSSQLG